MNNGNILVIEDNEPTARWLILTTIRDEQTVIPRTALLSQQLLLQCMLCLREEVTEIHSERNIAALGCCCCLFSTAIYYCCVLDVERRDSETY